jgi:hypothetical protein
MNTNICKCNKDPESAGRSYIRYINYSYKLWYNFNCLCPCFSCAADIGRILQLHERLGQQVGGS